MSCKFQNHENLNWSFKLVRKVEKKNFSVVKHWRELKETKKLVVKEVSRCNSSYVNEEISQTNQKLLKKNSIFLGFSWFVNKKSKHQPFVLDFEERHKIQEKKQKNQQK